MLSINQVLKQGRYRITRQFGQDGSSSVYEAFDNVLEANVMLKESVVSAPGSASAELQAEANALTRLEHESFVRVHDHFSETDRSYLAFESTGGRGLDEMQVKKDFSIGNALDWADQLLDAAMFLHNQRPPILHGSISPKNVKLTPQGKVKLLPPRISPSRASAAGETGSMNFLPLEEVYSGLDSASQKVITNNFGDRSIELLNQPSDVRSDIYSLGATLYRMLTGTLPVDALERTIEIVDGNADPLRSPSQVDQQIPSGVSDLVMKAMQVKREDRFDSVAIMRQVLRTSMLKAKEEAPRPVPPTPAPVKASATPPPAEDAQKKLELARLQLEAEQKRIAAESARIEQEKLKLIAEQKRQADAARKAPAEPVIQDLSADGRAIDLEQAAPLQVEINESHIVDVMAYEAAEIIYDAPVIPDEKDTVIEAAPAAAVDTAADDDLGGIFAAEPSAGMGWKLPAAVVGLGLAGVAAFGVWTISSSDAKVAKPAPVAVQPAPAVEPAAPAPVQAEASLPAASESPAAIPAVETQTVEPAPEQRPAAQAARSKKPAAAPAKPAPQKKAVTADDLINDN